MSSPENADVMRVIAQQTQRDYDLLSTIATATAERIAAISTVPLRADASDSDITARFNALREVEIGLREIQVFANNAAGVPVRSLNLSQLQNVKDVDLLLRSTPANRGDDVLLRIYNFRNEPARVRSVDVRVGVREFGWVRNVTDSYMFFHREGLGHDYRVRIARDSVIADSIARTTGVAAQYSYALSMNFDPALGVTLGWTYYQRQEHRWFSLPLRWLQPGFGINVSFPRFATRTVTVSRANPEQTNSTLTRKPAETRPQIGLSTGGVLSFFDGGIQGSYGYSLASGRKRAYWALGFSFFEVAKRIAQAAGS